MFKSYLTILVLGSIALAAQSVDRTKAPATPPIPGYKLPPIYETKLPNGLTVVLLEDARFPLVTVRLNFQAGSKFDPKDMPGLAAAVASTLREGTKTRTSRQISEETDAIGGSLGAGSGPDALTISGGALSENLVQLLGLVADLSLNATFPPDEVTLYKQNRTQNLKLQHSQPAFLANEKMAEIVYGASPYAHIAPTVESIQKLDTKTLASFRDTYLVPNNATLIVIGKLPARAVLLKAITQQFGGWQQKPVPALEKSGLPKPQRQIVLVDRPGSVQADVRVSRLAPTRSASDYFPLMVGNTILGGSPSSRMFNNIREKQGFAYDAHSEYDTNRDAAMITAVTQVRNEVIEPALKSVLAELNTIATAPVSAAELTDTKNFMAGLFLLRLETQDGVATQLNSIRTLGLPNDYLENYTTRVRSVEPDQIEAAAKKYLAPDRAAIVVVGDASKIGDSVKKLGEVKITKAN
ncbi:MAG: insulinase family protein [Acidobacteriota bacterium]|nr:insulinase family protein [Acidobacteriota bacterium]